MGVCMNRGHQLDEIDRLRAENERLREELREVRVLISDYWEPEVERLRAEITGLREDDEAKQAEVEGLRAALRDMLNVSPQSYDWYQGAARAALNEGKALVEERSRVIDERDAYDGSGA